MPPPNADIGPTDRLAALEQSITESTRRLRERLAAGDFEGAADAARARHAALQCVPAGTGGESTTRVRALLESALAINHTIADEATVHHARLQRQMQQLRRHSQAQTRYGETHTG